MSSIYIQEPPTFGKVLLKTTVGDIDIELWSKEAPKACRNFVQLCMEGYYNGTIFHRVVKEFIAQGGDPTGTGEGGESIWGHPFKDEFHSRLRFCRRGLVAMANAGKDDNGSQFFFTLGPTQELQNKHTIFGKVTGETVYNMLKLADGEFDQNERPEFPQKIVKTTVLNNPFDDIVPRVHEKQKSKRKKDKKTGVKDFKLLSFGEQAEEDEVETERENKKFSGKSKSTHDLLDDPKLSSQPAVVKEGEEQEPESESDLSGDEKEQEAEAKSSGDLSKVKNKLSLKKSSTQSKKTKDDDEEPDVEYVLGQDEREARKRKAEELKKEYEALRKSMKKPKEKEEEPEEEEKESEVLQAYNKEKEEYESKKKQLPKKGTDREAFTMALLAKFQKKLGKMKEAQNSDEEDEVPDAQEDEPEVADADFGKDEGQWMSRKLRFNQNAPILAKDASTKDERPGDWFDLNDPRNPINQRRREGHKSSKK